MMKNRFLGKIDPLMNFLYQLEKQSDKEVFIFITFFYESMMSLKYSFRHNPFI